jgi:hypothetical protein
MTTATTVRVWAGLALTLLVTVPAAAQAPADEQSPVQIGPVGVRPRVAITNFGVDSNVFNDARDPKQDFTFTASPNVELVVRPGRLRVLSTVGTDFVYYQKYSRERSVNRSVSARAELDLAIVKPFVSIAATHTSARPNSEVDIRRRHQPRTYAIGSTFPLTTRTSAGFVVRRASDKYDEGTFFRDVDVSTTLNSTTTSYEASLGMQLTPLTSVSIVTSQEQMRFDHSPLRDSDTFRIAPTVSFSPGGILNGSASLGYRHFRGRDSDPNGVADYNGLVATGAVGFSLLDRFRIETTFVRDVKYSYEQQLPYYVVNGGRVTATTALAGGFDVRAIVGRESLDYRAPAGSDGPGRDRMITYGGGVGYRLTDSAQLVLQAEILDRSSERDTSREYSNHRIFGSLNWGVATR